MKILLTFLLFLIAASATRWIKFYEAFKGDFDKEEDIKGWQANRKVKDGFIQKCGSKFIFGGRYKFGKKIQVHRNFNQIPDHTKIKVKLTLWQLDSWDQPPYHGTDDWKVYIDGKFAHKEIKDEGPYGGKNICGSPFGDVVENVEFQVSHVKSSLRLLFTDTFNEGIENETWGITDLEIYYDGAECSGTMYGDICLTDEKFQKCYDQLQQMDDKISNICEFEKLDDQRVYKFTISYDNGYKFDESCFTQEVDFQGVDLQQGSKVLNQWQFNAKGQHITYRIKHDDLESKYKCKKITQKSEYIWLCDTSLHVLFTGKRQLTYSFQLKVSLKRDHTDSIALNVIQNHLIGSCCQNDLKIDTTLKFCETWACDSYLDTPLTVRRKDDLYIEHAIATPEFEDYYLHYISLKLGPMIPEIIKKDTSQKGRILYHIRPMIALDDMTVEAISRLDENPQKRFRILQENLGDDYKIKGENMITVVEDEQDLNVQMLEQNGQNDLYMYGFIGACSALVVGGVAFVVRGRCKKNELKMQEQKDKLEVEKKKDLELELEGQNQQQKAERKGSAGELCEQSDSSKNIKASSNEEIMEVKVDVQ